MSKPNWRTSFRRCRCSQHDIAGQRREKGLGTGERLGTVVALAGAKTIAPPVDPAGRRPARPTAPSARRRTPRTRCARASASHPAPSNRPSIAFAWPQKLAYDRSPMPSTAYRTPSSAGASADWRRSQKPAPLSGGPPSPNVLVTISTRGPRPTRDSGMSSMLISWEPPVGSGEPAPRSPRHCRSATPTTPGPPTRGATGADAGAPDAVRRQSVENRCDVDLFVVAQYRLTLARGRVRRRRVHGFTGRRLTAHTLNSGCSESGSTASLVSALIVRYSPCSSFQ